MDQLLPPMPLTVPEITRPAPLVAACMILTMLPLSGNAGASGGNTEDCVVFPCRQRTGEGYLIYGLSRRDNLGGVKHLIRIFEHQFKGEITGDFLPDLAVLHSHSQYRPIR